MSSTHRSYDEALFRGDVREFMAHHLPADFKKKSEQGRALQKEDFILWQRELVKKGWGAPHWDARWGGTDWSIAQKFAFEDEMVKFDAPIVPVFNVRMIGPIIQAYGSEEQKQRFLPKTLNFDYWWCQGYSEPSSGSDLASLQTSAVREGDNYVVNGAKIWTTYAHYANWMFCLVRTDREAKKQQGISFLLIDMSAPGVTVSPIKHFYGKHFFNQIFLENVKVPVANRVGEENTGWTIAKALLEHERVITSRYSEVKRRLRRLVTLAQGRRVNGKPIIQQGHVRHRIAALITDVRALNYSAMRSIDNLVNTGHIGASASVLKLKGVALTQRIEEAMVDIMGPNTIVAEREFDAAEVLGLNPDARNVLENRYYLRGPAIAGGSNEVQRSVIAKHILKLG